MVNLFYVFTFKKEYRREGVKMKPLKTYLSKPENLLVLMVIITIIITITIITILLLIIAVLCPGSESGNTVLAKLLVFSGFRFPTSLFVK